MEKRKIEERLEYDIFDFDVLSFGKYLSYVQKTFEDLYKKYPDYENFKLDDGGNVTATRYETVLELSKRIEKENRKKHREIQQLNRLKLKYDNKENN